MSDENKKENPFRLDPEDLKPLDFEALEETGTPGPQIVKNSGPRPVPATAPKVKPLDVPESQELFVFFGLQPNGTESVAVVDLEGGQSIPLVTSSPEFFRKMLQLAAGTVAENPDVTLRIAKFTQRSTLGVVTADTGMLNDESVQGKAVAVMGPDGVLRPYTPAPQPPADPEQFDDTKPGDTGAEGDQRI